jgi:hypothetical protein
MRERAFAAASASYVSWQGNDAWLNGSCMELQV